MLPVHIVAFLQHWFEKRANLCCYLCSSCTTTPNKNVAQVACAVRMRMVVHVSCFAKYK